LPVVAANPTGFLDVSHNAATTPHSMGRTSIWFLFAHAHTLHLHVPPGYPSEFVVYRIPVWVARLSHPMILVGALPFTALLARRGSGPPPRDALAILALAFLLRCVLDPVDNAYYHAPLVLALLAWEVLGCARRVPLVTLLTSAALWITFDRVEPVARPTVANGVYLAWTTALLFYLVYALAVRRDAPRYSSNDAEVRTYEAATPVPTLGARAREHQQEAALGRGSTRPREGERLSSIRVRPLSSAHGRDDSPGRRRAVGRRARPRLPDARRLPGALGPQR
jgi:hypothetical protein